MMLRKATDFKKLPHEIVIDMINADNGTQLAPNALSFGFPEVMPENKKRNTKLEVYAGVGSGFKGAVKIQYRRIPLQEMVGDKSTTFNLGEGRYWHDLIPAINERYGINLTPNDYIDGPITKPVYGTSQPMGLMAAPQSLVWIEGFQLDIFADIPDGIPLRTVITDLYLDTIDYERVDNCEDGICSVAPGEIDGTVPHQHADDGHTHPEETTTTTTTTATAEPVSLSAMFIKPSFG